MNRLAGKVALVTGGGSGIGHASALALARDGAAVALCDVNIANGEAAAAQIRSRGGEAKFFRADMVREDEVAHLIAGVVAAFGGLHCAFNNVGLGKANIALLDETVEDWDWTVGLSLKSTFLSLKHQIPVMLAGGGGGIVNTASMAGVIYANTATASYSAAKAGVIQLTKYAAQAYGPQNIRVNSISPGLVATPLIESMLTPDQQRAIAGEHQVIARAAQPSDIADGVVYLCSDRSAMLTGINLEICGGRR